MTDHTDAGSRRGTDPAGMKAFTDAASRLASLLQALPDIVYIKDTLGRNISVNTAFEELAGRPAVEIIGRTDDDLLPADLAAKCRESDLAVFEGGRSIRFEEKSSGPGGDARVYETIKSPIFDEAGEIIGLLGVSRDITARKIAEEALRASVREKEVLIKEVHHRVKNNMQIISSILNLQSGSVRDPAARECLAECQSRIRSMSLVHEKLYRSGNLSRIDFGEYLRSLSAALFHSCRTDSHLVRLDVHAADVSLDVNTAIPCGLIANELIVNALKHGFPEGRSGRLRVGFDVLGDGLYRMAVSDDGAGFPADLDFRLTDTLGLQLVTLLVDQLDGTIELDRSKGTAFTITFGEAKPSDGVLDS